MLSYSRIDAAQLVSHPTLCNIAITWVFAEAEDSESPDSPCQRVITVIVAVCYLVFSPFITDKRCDLASKAKLELCADSCSRVSGAPLPHEMVQVPSRVGGKLVQVTRRSHPRLGCVIPWEHKPLPSGASLLHWDNIKRWREGAQTLGLGQEADI